MGSVCSSIQNCEYDRYLTYHTPKVVVIKDRFLASLKIFFWIVILVYIVYTLIIQGNYTDREPPIGVVSSSLQRPPNHLIDSRNMTYCKNYNKQAIWGNSTYNDQLDCIAWDEGDALFPVDQSNGMFITTRATIQNQQRLCPLNATSCTQVWGDTLNTSRSYYTLGIDQFTIQLDHSFHGASWDPQQGGSSLAMAGQLVSHGGKDVIKAFNSGEHDIMDLDLLMKAGDIKFSDSFNASDPRFSVRYMGLVLVVFIRYRTERIFYPYQYSYTYEVYPVNATKFKAVQIIPEGDSNRVSIDRHGAKVIFLFTGELRRFNLTVLLVQLVTSLGLLSIANFVVDLLMIYTMPLRKWYQRYKYQETLKFHEIDYRQFDHNAYETITDFHRDARMSLSHSSINNQAQNSLHRSQSAGSIRSFVPIDSNAVFHDGIDEHPHLDDDEAEFAGGNSRPSSRPSHPGSAKGLSIGQIRHM